MTNIVDDLVRESHQAAKQELTHMLERVRVSDMTPCEVVAFVTLVRPIFDRVQAKTAPVAPVLQLTPSSPPRHLAI